jgi:hypothetical protein
MHNTVNHTGSSLARKPQTCPALSKLLYRPDDTDNGRNVVTKPHIFILGKDSHYTDTYG